MVFLEFAKNRKAGNPKAHNFKKQGEYMKRTIPMLCSVLFLFTVAADCEAARLGGRTTIDRHDLQPFLREPIRDRPTGLHRLRFVI